MSEPFESQLTQGNQRFLAHVVEHGLEHGRRTHEDFLRHFPPTRIMSALADEPDRRSKIMVIATGVRSRIAVKQTPDQCASVLDIALEEHETDAETIVSWFLPDDRVRFLPAVELWAYVKEGEFWNVEADGDAFDIAKDHIAFMLERALLDNVITARDVVDGIGVDAIARHMPSDDLAKIIGAALDAGRGGTAFRDHHLLDRVPCRNLVRHVPLKTIWEGVVGSRIAKALGVLPVALRPHAIPPGPAELTKTAAAAQAPADPGPSLRARAVEAVSEDEPVVDELEAFKLEADRVEAEKVEVELDFDIDVDAAMPERAKSTPELPRASLTSIGATKKSEPEGGTGRKSRRPSAKPSRRSKRPSAPAATSGKVQVPGPGKS